MILQGLGIYLKKTANNGIKSFAIAHSDLGDAARPSAVYAKR